MFRTGQSNPYDDIVVKTTDENLTGENWELILNLCDKVQDEGEQGARNVIAALLKRLAHRNPNVQLLALSLAESLSKNCGVVLHREIASRAFTQGLEKIITDRTTHEKVRRRALTLIAMWTSEFENDSTLGMMEECYTNLKAKSYKFETPQEAPPPNVDDEARRREEEELQRVLEMSIQDKGGRSQWAAYSPSASASGSTPGAGLTRAGSTSRAPTQSFNPPTYQGGYVPARTPSPVVSAAPVPAATSTTSLDSTTAVTPTVVPSSTTATSTTATTTTVTATATGGVVTRVRALHAFEPSEPGELAFEKGDVIKVVDRGYQDWWRGQLRGRTGIFPVNYVEPLPEPTPAELAREAEQEHAVFAQAASVDQLLTMLRALDPARESLADNEEIQELYRACMALRPKIVKLIDKYSQKKADLVSMNDSFMRARTIFDQMMEESLARHTAAYEQRPYRPPVGPGSPYPIRPDTAGPQYAWAVPGGYPPGLPPHDAYPGHQPPQQQQQVYAQQQVPQGPVQQQQGQAYPPQPYGAQPYPVYAQQQAPPQPEAAPSPQVQQPQPQQAQQALQSQVQQTQQQQQQQQQQQPSQPQPTQQQQPIPGPPYVYDPHGVYTDPNVQAWASYYSQGGTDPTGLPYFISVPGVTDQPAGPVSDGAQNQQVHAQPVVQQAGSPGHDAYGAYHQPSAGAAPEVGSPGQQHSIPGELAGYAGPARKQSLRTSAVHAAAPVSSQQQLTSTHTSSLPYPGPSSSTTPSATAPAPARQDSIPNPWMQSQQQAVSSGLSGSVLHQTVSKSPPPGTPHVPGMYAFSPVAQATVNGGGEEGPSLHGAQGATWHA